jgi:Xaa-Pro aminopeptidase
MSRVDRLLAQLPPGAGALAGDHANVRWLTGMAGEPHRLYGNAPLWAAVAPGGEWRVVAPASELAWLDEQGDVDRVIPYGRFAFAGDGAGRLRALATAGQTPEQALASALDAVGAGERVLVDDGPRPTALERARAALAPRRLELDPAPFARARMVKDGGELSVLRAVNAAAEAGIEAALERARPGVSEAQLLAWVREAMVARGAQPLLGDVGIGARGALVDFVPGDRALRSGDVIRFDVGCVLDGYHADLARTAALGRAPGWARDAHAALVAGQEAALAALRPGATGAALFDAAVAAARAAGLPDYDRSHCGHGIGLDIYEPPLVAPGHDEPLVAGMTLCVETPLYLSGLAGLQIEDAVVVTRDGFERLGTLPRQLLTVD